jgi:transcriptional regulator with XRE-family HTH domain
MNHSNSLRDAGLRKRRATAEDAAIGEKLRALRLDRGLSQSDLGERVGVTFQQLQKYEKGVNRVSVGRLARIVAALNVPITAFYDAAKRGKTDRTFSYLQTRGAVRLVRAYGDIPARGSKAALVTLAEALARRP